MQGISELQSLRTTIKTNAVKFQHLNLDSCLKRLIYGSFVKKLTKKGNGKVKKTFFYIYESDLSQLRWISKNKIFRDAKIDLRTVTTVSETPVSLKRKKLTKYENEEVLSILYGKEEELILIFENRDDKLAWWCGIEYFIQKSRHQLSRSKETLGEIANEIFHRADKDGSKALTRDEIRNILKELQCNIKKKDFNELFARYDRDNSSTIDQMEFRELINEIFRKKELASIFKKYCGKNYQNNVYDIPLMSLNQYLEFLKVEQQNSSANIRDLKYLGDKLKTVLPDEPSLSFDDFSGLIFSANNSIFNPKHMDVYQDMNQPLTDYYINSSHNTYLEGNQITGISSVNAYVQAINKGCRCVELDIWPGDKGEPVIYHGHTLTSKILFEDVIKALAEHSFVTSPYPMILSFEMHCDVKLQGKIAAILEQHLSDSIYVITPEEKNRKFYPSPNDLKYKFIIKGKGILKPVASKIAKPDNTIEAMVANVMFDYEEEATMTQAKSDNVQKMVNLSVVYQTRVELHRLQLADLRIKSPFASSKLNSAKQDSKAPIIEVPIVEEEAGDDQKDLTSKESMKANMKKSLKIDTDKANELYDKSLNLKKVHSENLGVVVKNTDSFQGDIGLEPENDDEPDSPTEGAQSTNGEKAITPKKEKLLKVSPELNHLYAMIGGKLTTKNRSCWHIVSLSENKINSLIKKDLHGITDIHKRFLTRAYPAGLRFDSSNYDPIPSWNIGSQIVALNFQTPDEPMLLTYSKFMANGGLKSGYLLKPDFLTHTALDNPNPQYGDQFLEVKKRLTIKIISGQQIRPDNFSTKEIIDPYIEVKLRGLAIDENKNATKRTHVIMDNGMNPLWSDGKHDEDVTFEFQIHAPDLCTIVFYVWDDDKIGRDKIGWYAIDFNNIQPGYRVIPIWNDKFQPIRFSYIFCHIKIEDKVFRI